MTWRTAVLCMAFLVAQEHSDWSGHWELIRSADAKPGAVIAIDIMDSGRLPRVLSVTRYFETGGAEMRDYPVGAASARVGGMSVRGGIPTPLSFQSVRWDKSTLLIDQEGDPGPERHERWSINDAGELVIESSDRPANWATEKVAVRYRHRE
jgi:hypothetical protein